MRINKINNYISLMALQTISRANDVFITGDDDVDIEKIEAIQHITYTKHKKYLTDRIKEDSVVHLSGILPNGEYNNFAYADQRDVDTLAESITKIFERIKGVCLPTVKDAIDTANKAVNNAESNFITYKVVQYKRDDTIIDHILSDVNFRQGSGYARFEIEDMDINFNAIQTFAKQDRRPIFNDEYFDKELFYKMFEVDLSDEIHPSAKDNDDNFKKYAMLVALNECGVIGNVESDYWSIARKMLNIYGTRILEVENTIKDKSQLAYIDRKERTVNMFYGSVHAESALLGFAILREKNHFIKNEDVIDIKDCKYAYHQYMKRQQELNVNNITEACIEKVTSVFKNNSEDVSHYGETIEDIVSRNIAVGNLSESIIYIATIIFDKVNFDMYIESKREITKVYAVKGTERNILIAHNMLLRYLYNYVIIED